MSGILKAELRDFAGRKITFSELSRRAKRTLGNKNITGVMDVLEEGARSARNLIVLGMRNSPPTGKLYRRGSKTHRASSPGRYPRTDSGAMVQSIGVDVRSLEVEVGSRITSPAYPLYLEKGTNKMEARPWLEPSVKTVQFKMHHRMMKVLRKSADDFIRGRR